MGHGVFFGKKIVRYLKRAATLDLASPFFPQQQSTQPRLRQSFIMHHLLLSVSLIVLAQATLGVQAQKLAGLYELCGDKETADGPTVRIDCVCSPFKLLLQFWT